MRLGPQPGEVIDRSRTLAFRWNGRPYSGHPGDTIASALAAAGERVFSRSYKYHRPRGLLTADFLDPGCHVQVGDEPNVRGAHRLVEDGHGRALAEHLAVAAVRPEGRQRAGRAVPGSRLLLQDLHQARTAVAGLRTGAAPVRARRCSSPRTPRTTTTTSATPTPRSWSRAAAQPGWRPRWRRPGPGRGCCSSRRSTSSADTCGGATTRNVPSAPSSRGRCAPSRVSRS